MTRARRAAYARSRATCFRNRASHVISSTVQDRLSVVLHQDVGAVRQLRERWSDLAGSADQPLFFQSPAWVDHVAAVRGARGEDRWRTCLADVRRGDRPIGLWPLSLQREGLSWIARTLDDPFGQFAGLLTASDDDADDVVGAVVDALKREGLAAGLMIERIPEDTALHRSLAARGGKLIYSDQSAIVDFRPHGSFEDYLKTRKPKTRKNLRNARNRLTRDHEIEHDVVTGDGDLRSIMDQAFQSRLVWMHDHAKTAPAFRDADFRRLLDGLAGSGLTRELIGFRLRVGSVPIAVQWGFVHAGRYYAFISARNPEFDAYSPGRLHLGMVLEACFERGIELVELMAPASDYKMNWTDETRRIDDIGLAFTAAGYLYLDLWRRHGRAMLRRLYHGLPDGIRRHVSELAGGRRAS